MKNVSGERAYEKGKKENHAVGFKAKAAIATIKGVKTLAELAGQLDMLPISIQPFEK